MTARGDDYADLAEALERGLTDHSARGDGLRQRYTMELGTWDAMVTELLGQLADDAGSVRRALVCLGTPTRELIGAWMRGTEAGTRASSAWLAAQRVAKASSRAARTPSVRALRGDDERDLADAGARVALAGDGALDPVAPAGDRLGLTNYLDLIEAIERDAVAGDNELDPPHVRDVYVVRLDSWAQMEADLLTQIVADAGSIRRASKLIDMPRSTLGARLVRARRRPA